MRQIIIIIGLISVVGYQVIAQETDATDMDEQLMMAAEKGDTAVLSVLVNRGIDLNTSTYEGYTPLMFASMNGHDSAVRLLIRSGAKPDMQDGVSGYTALIYAVLNGYLGTAETLIRQGAGINIGDKRSVTPLMHAIEVDSFYLPDLLLYYGANVLLKDNNGRNALMVASRYGRFEMAVSLLEAEMDVNDKDAEGNTALHYATLAGNTELMDLLLLNGAAIDQRNNQGYTPLAIAVSKGNYNAVKLLIGYGADVNAKVSKSVNMLILAESIRNDSIKRLLMVNHAERIRRLNFDQVMIGADYVFNKYDSQFGFLFGFYERRYNISTVVRYGFRPNAVQVLEREEENVYYQFWEKRHYISLSLTKSFFVQEYPSGIKTGAYAGMTGIFTFGSYKGSSQNPDARFIFDPGAGMMIKTNNIMFKFGYEWIDLGLRGFDNGWFGASVSFMFNTKKNKLRIA